MKSRFLTIVVTLVFCCGFTAAVLLVGEFFRRRGTALAGLKTPDSLVLLAIDGAEDVEAKYTRAVAAGEEVFHQYAVLGKVEITDADERAQIVAGLQQAVLAPGPQPQGHCFRPRHALIARENGQTIELAISFECSRYHRYGRERENYPAISSSAERILTRHLTDAGVSLAP